MQNIALAHVDCRNENTEMIKKKFKEMMWHCGWNIIQQTWNHASHSSLGKLF